MPPTDLADAAGLLAVAVTGIGGSERPGQVTMARAVQRAIETGEHLAVQAGTGTGKSLAYLVPAARHAVTEHGTIVVSTATIALQRQLIDRDLPRLAAAIAPALGREPAFAILKGRRNYLCLQRLRSGPPDDQGEALFDPGMVSAIARQVQRLHEWAATTATGDRDELVPGVTEQAWRQVSVSARECLGVQRCPFGQQCFAEFAREEAGKADVVVTNPTHVSVALRYRPLEGAPVVTAKGYDDIAMHIRELAKEHGVNVIRSPPLARALASRVRVGRTIPADLYAAVAEVLAFVYRIRGRKWA